MLTTPVFRPWRPIWDDQLADAMQRLDEFAKERQKGRQTPPPVHDWSDVQRDLLAVHSAKLKYVPIAYLPSLLRTYFLHPALRSHRMKDQHRSFPIPDVLIIKPQG